MFAQPCQKKKKKKKKWSAPRFFACGRSKNEPSLSRHCSILRFHVLQWLAERFRTEPKRPAWQIGIFFLHDRKLQTVKVLEVFTDIVALSSPPTPTHTHTLAYHRHGMSVWEVRCSTPFTINTRNCSGSVQTAHGFLLPHRPVGWGGVGLGAVSQSPWKVPSSETFLAVLLCVRWGSWRRGW